MSQGGGRPSTISGSDVTYAQVVGYSLAGHGAGGANTGSGGSGGGDNNTGAVQVEVQELFLLKKPKLSDKHQEYGI
jgi:hypothetical protein